MSNTQNEISPVLKNDLGFIIELFNDSGITFNRKDTVWSKKENNAVRTSLSIGIPFPKIEEEPEAVMEWIFKDNEIFDINVYSKENFVPEPFDPPEFAYTCEPAVSIGFPSGILPVIC